MKRDAAPVPPTRFESLLITWIRLGARERRVVVSIAKRLLAGQDAYGVLTKGKKNWVREANEEFLDAAVYLANETIDAEDDAP